MTTTQTAKHTPKPLSSTQIDFLHFFRHNCTEDGRIELGLQTGIVGNAAEKVIDSLKRRGLIGDDGYTSAAGLAAIAKATA